MRASMPTKRTKNQNTLLHRLKASILPTTHMCLLCPPADTQAQYDPGVLYALCASEGKPAQRNKNTLQTHNSCNRTQTVMAIYHCPSSQIFPVFLTCYSPNLF